MERARLGVTGPSYGLVVALILLAGTVEVGCSRGHDGTMVSVPPPERWADGVMFHRGRRNEYMRESAETPLTAEAVEQFAGLSYWEPDPAYYFVGDLHRYANPHQFSIPTTAGQARPCERYGWVEFPLGGVVQTLQVYRLLDMEDPWEALLLPFRDETSGTETYPAGRYIDLYGAEGGPYVLDFNNAYNPSCAYGDVERFACPVTPAENRLTVRVEAGERGFVAESG